jgi:hypothetical protein
VASVVRGDGEGEALVCTAIVVDGDWRPCWVLMCTGVDVGVGVYVLALKSVRWTAGDGAGAVLVSVSAELE